MVGSNNFFVILLEIFLFILEEIGYNILNIVVISFEKMIREVL